MNLGKSNCELYWTRPYEKHGVNEYWIVKSDGSVFVWLLEDGQYKPVTEYLRDMPVPSAVLDGFSWGSRG